MSNKVFPKLKYWKEINYWRCDDNGNQLEVELSMGSYDLRALVKPDKSIKLQTSCGGGHGFPSFNVSGKSSKEWIDLIKEAGDVINFYWGKL